MIYFGEFSGCYKHIPGLPDLILFWMNDVSVIRVSRYGITRGTLSGKHVLTLIWMIMTDGSFKIVSNWTVLTLCLYQQNYKDVNSMILFIIYKV